MMTRLRLLIVGYVLVAGTLVVVTAASGAEDPPAAVARAAKLIDEGKIADARTALTQFRRGEPDNPAALFHLGRIETDGDRAIWYFREVERLGDGAIEAEALLRRADIHIARGDTAEALEAWEQALALPDATVRRPEVLYHLGMTALASGDTTAARERFTACLTRADAGEYRALARAGLMESAVLRGDWVGARDEALAALTEPDDISALTPRILEVLAQSWRELGSEENADRFLDRLLDNYPASYQAYALRRRASGAAGSIAYSTRNPDSADTPAAPGVSSPAATAPATTIPPGRTTAGNTPATSAQGSFSVQASAFRDRNNALQQLRILRDLGFDARVDTRTVNNQNYFVIRVGRFITRADAETMAKRVAAATGASANVVVIGE